MIEVYPSKLPGEPMDVLEVDQPMTLEDWLAEGNPDYIPVSQLHEFGLGTPPISIKVNGSMVPPAEWASTVIDTDSTVEVRREGKDPYTIVYAVISAVISAAASYFLRPDVPTLGQSQAGPGDSIAVANAEGNRIKLGDVIPEQSGRVRFYPDLISQPRRWFSGPKEQSLSLLMTYGVGQFEVHERNIEKTNFNNLNINYQEFIPGQNVTGHVAHENWYTVREVGSTAGNSGIKLLSNRDVSQTWEGTLTFSGDTIDPSNNESPTGWSIGTQINAVVPIDVEIINAGGYSVFHGHFGSLVPVVGQRLRRFSGGLELDYRIVSYTEGTSGGTDSMELEKFNAGAWFPENDIADGNYTFQLARLDSQSELAVCRITNLATNGTATVEFMLSGTVITSWEGWEPTTTANANVRLAGAFDEGVWSNIIQMTPPNTPTSVIEWDIFAPQGLCELGETSGNIYELTRTVEFRYRPAGSTDPWTTVSHTITGDTRDQLGWSFQTTLHTAMEPEAQVRRVEAESNRVQVIDSLEWFGAKAKLPAATSYADVTVLAMTLVGSNEIASRTENRVNILATRKIPPVGGGGTLVETRDIAPWIRYIALNSEYTPQNIDIDELTRLHNIWSPRGDTFDFRTTSASTVKTSFNRALQAGFAQMSSVNGVLLPVRDEPKTEYTQMYTPQNMLALPRRKFSAKKTGDIDGVNVRYVDAETWTEEVVECRLPGDLGLSAEEMTVEGVTDRTRAWRIGMRRRRAAEYRRWEYSFSTETDALNSNYGDFISMGDDIPTYGKSALVLSASAQGSDAVLNLSEAVEWQAGQTHVIAWRRVDGKLMGPYPAQQGANAHQVIAVGSNAPIIGVSQERPHVQFGTTAKWTFPTLVRKIDPQGMFKVNVVGENYDERVYDDDNNPAPN